ncbi:hypothetical protein CW702_00975 [Candidatus Bathyarchaeota archaeon]|nr:MAG: hypothetical protein CW702_00975 [Candidatus Bathyarchaeota archaeon]
MKSRYLRVDLSVEGEAYVRNDIAQGLTEVNAAIFDCDGVLIDARDSYNRAIAKTVWYIISHLTGVSFPDKAVTDEVIAAFKRGGGFNSDWDLAYAIIMFTVSSLPQRLIEAAAERVSSIRFSGDNVRDFHELTRKSKVVKSAYNIDFIRKWNKRVLEFAASIDESGIEDVERKLIREVSSSMNKYELYMKVKDLLNYPGGIGESVVSTVFEEFFRGASFYQDSCGLKPLFNESEKGLVDLEKPIIKIETLVDMENIFGEAKFGIASGSFLKPAEHILGDILKRFKREAIIFYDEIYRAELNAKKRGGKIVNLKKPNPFSILKSASSLEPFKRAVYVGDSMEDALTVRNANKKDPRYIFVGVYKHSPPPDETLRDFINFGCEVILPTVNELPYLLRWVRRYTR